MAVDDVLKYTCDNCGSKAEAPNSREGYMPDGWSVLAKKGGFRKEFCVACTKAMEEALTALAKEKR